MHTARCLPSCCSHGSLVAALGCDPATLHPHHHLLLRPSNPDAHSAFGSPSSPQVDHFLRFKTEERQLPVVWQQTLLCFVQR